MKTVAQIAKQAFDKVAAKISGAIHSAVITYQTQGAYDPVAGEYPVVDVTLTGRAVQDSVKPIADIFPAYVAGPSDALVLLEGFSTLPQENWKLSFAGKVRTIRQVQDIVAAGSLFYVVAR